jgi:hypothetical protein
MGPREQMWGPHKTQQHGKTFFDEIIVVVKLLRR